MFSIVAIVAMMATAVPTATLGAASYSAELEGAYDYAYGIGITTQGSIETANMYGTLIRSHMAKMMVNYAKEVKGLTPDTSLACEFTDVANETAEMKGYITEACQMGLMGQGITAFNPNGVVTRAQFGTVLSRVLYGDAYDGGDPYYAEHLQALKDAGIMTKIDNPNAPEVRGYVMLMMQRADEGAGNPEICQTPENVLSCSLGLDTCPAECVTTEVKAGSLNVSLGNSLSDGTQIPNAGIVRFATVNFKASSNDVSLKTIKIGKVGLSDVPAGTKVWFENNGVRVTGRSSFTSDGEAYLSFAPAYVVKAGSTEPLDLYVELATTSVGADIQFKSIEVNSTAQDTNGSFTTPSLRTANYTVSAVTFTADTANGSAKVTENGVELGSFTLGSIVPSRDVTVKSITLRQQEAASLNNLSDVVLERNGVVVSNGFSVDGKYLTVKLNDVISKDTSSVKYILKAIVTNVETAADKYDFKLNNTSDFNAIETLNGFRVSLNGTYDFGTYTINGGDLTFARDTSLDLSKEYSAGSPVVLLKGSITSKEAVNLEDISFLLQTATSNLSTYFTTLYLKVGTSIFSYTPVVGDVAWGTIKFEWSVTVDGTANVQLYGTLRTNAAGTIKFAPLDLNSFTVKEYVSNGITVNTAVGSIAGITVAIQNTPLYITRIDGLGDTAVSAGTDNVTLYEVKLSSNQGNGVRVSNATFTVAAGGSFTNNTTLTLFVNGVAKESKTFNGTSPVSFVNFGNVTVNSTNDATVKIVANINENVANTQTIRVTMASVTATDLLTSSTVTPSWTFPAGALFTVGASAASISATDLNTKPELWLAWSTDKKLIAFKINATNDNVTLYDVALNGWSNLDKMANFRLTNTSGEVVATATSVTASTVTFSSISGVPAILKDKFATYYVIADVNTNVNNVDVKLNLTADGTKVKASNWLVVAVADAYVAAGYETSIVTLTAAPTADGTATVNINGSPKTVTFVAATHTTTTLAAAKMAADLTAVAAGAYTATAAGAAVTITATAAGNQTNTTFADVNSLATATVAITDWVTAVAHTTVAGNTHKIVENTLLVAKLANPNKVLNTSAMRFSISAMWKNSVTVTALDLNAITNYTETAATIAVYKDTVSTANLVARSSVGTLSSNTWLTFVNQTIDAGSTVTYIVVVEGAVVGANTPDWTVTLSDVTFDGISAAAYTNAGEMPISEVK